MKKPVQTAQAQARHHHRQRHLHPRQLKLTYPLQVKAIALRGHALQPPRPLPLPPMRTLAPLLACTPIPIQTEALVAAWKR